MKTLADVQDLLTRARHVLILTGAGMSAELDVPTYWTGSNAKYGEAVSEYGYTELEHATEITWKWNPTAQQAFFQTKYAQLAAIDPARAGSPYRLLLDWLENTKKNYFVVTSNVDSFFLRSGFAEERIYEIHGAYRLSQCLGRPKDHGIFPTDPNGATLCPACGGATRPNVMFFDDFSFNPAHKYEQQDRFEAFRAQMVANRDVVIEVGAGNTVPTIRNMSVIMSARYDMPVIRINPNRVIGVDGIAGMIPKSATAPFVAIRQPVTEVFTRLLI